MYRDKNDFQNGLLNSSPSHSSPHSSHYEHDARRYHDVANSSDDSESVSSSDDWEWVYYDEVKCLSCPSSDSEDSSASETPPPANGIKDCQKSNAMVGDNAQYEYYEEQDVYGPEEANYDD